GDDMGLAVGAGQRVRGPGNDAFAARSGPRILEGVTPEDGALKVFALLGHTEEVAELFSDEVAFGASGDLFAGPVAVDDSAAGIEHEDDGADGVQHGGHEITFHLEGLLDAAPLGDLSLKAATGCRQMRGAGQE